MAIISLVLSLLSLILFLPFLWVPGLSERFGPFYLLASDISFPAGIAGFVLGVITRRFWQGKAAAGLQLLCLVHVILIGMND